MAATPPDAAEEISLTAVIAQLAPGRREAFTLTQVLGLSYAEAAQVCGCPIGTIRSRVARARSDLVIALDLDGEGIIEVPVGAGRLP